jgi:hypothetical protein
LPEPDLRAVRRVRRTLLADVVAGDLEIRRGVVADVLLDLPVLQVDDRERHPAVRADRGRHDLALLEDETVADRLDVLVGRDDLTLVGHLPDLVVAEAGRRGDRGAGQGHRDGGSARCDQWYSAPEGTWRALFVTPAAACYLHGSCPFGLGFS